jgi:hypothetical protein
MVAEVHDTQRVLLVETAPGIAGYRYNASATAKIPAVPGLNCAHLLALHSGADLAIRRAECAILRPLMVAAADDLLC